ncbi:MAG TPA: iron-containing alcohol dehydrogenase [Armatimonadota bacterium]|jgi:alcohol dehydrogenase class IV
MHNFRHLAPTAIEFGAGKLNNLGELTAPHGGRVLLVTESWEGPLGAIYARAKESLQAARLSVVVYDRAQPNPTVATIDAGAAVAQDECIEAVIGIGGGSTIDTAKGIAVAATHPGSVWDYMYFQPSQPSALTLPIIAVTTTSGTGAHATRYAVITKSDIECKSAIAHDNVFPRVGLVDPELMLGLPRAITASTSFDAFTHAFESYTNPAATPMTDLLNLQALTLITANLETVLADLGNLEGRAALAWADTLAGMCISNAGTTLPHAMGQPISGHFPHVAHGQSLAVVYPPFLRFTCEAAADKFTAVGRLLDPAVSDCHAAVEAMLAWMKRIGMYIGLCDINVPEEGLAAVLKDCMAFPDVACNPRVPDEAQVMAMYREALTTATL